MRGVPNGFEKKWNDETIAKGLREASAAIGSFPTASELRAMGLNNLICAATKTGGLMAWSDRLGMPRKHSDSDTGWDGEIVFMDVCRKQGLEVERLPGVKNTYDLLINNVLRVDVKAARYAEYGKRNYGWFFRIGKYVQAELVVLYQLDTNEFFGVPWWECPTGNITLRTGGGKYSDYRNNWNDIRCMVGWRMAERAKLGMKVAGVA